MSNALFPNLPGLTWVVKITPTTDTLIYPGADQNYEIRIPKMLDPRFEFELTYEFLRDDSNDEKNTLMGFWLARQGPFDSFLLDPATLTQKAADSSISNQLLTVDGNNYAPLVRTMGVSGYNETIYTVNAISVVKGNGVTIPQDPVGHNVVPASGHWSYWDASPVRTYGGTSYPGVVIQFGSAPATPVTVNFSWYYRVRFKEDTAEFDAFMFQLYELQKINLVTVRA